MGTFVKSRRELLKAVPYGAAAFAFGSLPAEPRAQSIQNVPLEVSRGQHGDVYFWRRDSKTKKFSDVHKLNSALKIDLTKEFFVSLTTKFNQIMANDDIAIVNNHTIVSDEEQYIPNDFGYRRIDHRDISNVRDSANESVDESLKKPSREEFLLYHKEGLDSRSVRLRLSHYTVDDLQFGNEVKSTRQFFANMEFVPFSEDTKFVRNASTLLVAKKSLGSKVYIFDFGVKADDKKIYASLHFANLKLDKRRFTLTHG